MPGTVFVDEFANAEEIVKFGLVESRIRELFDRRLGYEPQGGVKPA
jgi:hypothetical protein